jgi:glutaredoxin
MHGRPVDKNKYLAAFAISALIFFGGIFIGSYFSQQKVEKIDELSQTIRMSTMGTELQYELISQNPCSAVNSSELASELYQIGTRLDFMESELGSDDVQVINLKEYYHLLEVRHWLFLKRVKIECDKSYDLVLYFYSNKGDCSKCEEQGAVLTYLHNKYPELNIYSFDINIDNPALNTIKDMFSVKEAPTLVVNDKSLIGFKDRIELEEELFKSGLRQQLENNKTTN